MGPRELSPRAVQKRGEDMHSTAELEPNADRAPRKPYVRPEVTEYAPLTDLTLISPCPPLPC